jgi:hypothetical protein
VFSLVFCVRSRRRSSYLSIYVHFPKLDVAAGIKCRSGSQFANSLVNKRRCLGALSKDMSTYLGTIERELTNLGHAD